MTYANVMATVAVFIALGGTSYALTVPRNSVGQAQLRSDSVGRSELRRGAVTSPAIRDRSLLLRDVSVGARSSLRGAQGPPGPQGPAGPTYSAAIDSAGIKRRGNANYWFATGVSERVVGFDRPVTDCVATATLAFVAGGIVETPPADGHVTIAPAPEGRLLVRTWAGNGAPQGLPFNLIVAC